MWYGPTPRSRWCWARRGTAINPLLEGTTAGDPASRRLPVGNLLSRAVSVVMALAALGLLGRLMVTMEPDNAQVVANFHTLFNLFLPVLSPYARLLGRLLPPRTDPADPSRPLYLDPVARQIPMVARGNAAREALRLAPMKNSPCRSEPLRGSEDTYRVIRLSVLYRTGRTCGQGVPVVTATKVCANILADSPARFIARHLRDTDFPHRCGRS